MPPPMLVIQTVLSEDQVPLGVSLVNLTQMLWAAIVVAVDMIEKFTKKLKYKRRIILVTDGEAPIDGNDISDIAAKLKRCEIQLDVL